jgi:hypothetical protein
MTDLPREGPGEADGRPLGARHSPATPPGARILDAGCGPGGDIPDASRPPGRRGSPPSMRMRPSSTRSASRFPQVTAFAGDMATAEGPFDFDLVRGRPVLSRPFRRPRRLPPPPCRQAARLPSPSPASSRRPPPPTPPPSGKGYPARHRNRASATAIEGAGYRVLGTRRLVRRRMGSLLCARFVGPRRRRSAPDAPSGPPRALILGGRGRGRPLVGG